jgi:hypothetical protein
MVHFADFALLKEAKRVLAAARARAPEEKNRPRGRFAFFRWSGDQYFATTSELK